MKSWIVKREDETYLLNKNGTPKLFKTRGEAKGAGDKAKGENKPQRVNIEEV
jgi:hypothetical protein